MPAINVARTDTFEQQRLKINDIGSQVFSITQGGSDLATGNLKLGDGTRAVPSLAFTSDASLGIYKPEQKTIGMVSSGKIITDFNESAIYSYKDYVFRKKSLTTAGLSISNAGSGYEAGVYNLVSATGGTGENALLDVSVTEFTGAITNSGNDYNPGVYSQILLSGGSGTGAEAQIEVPGLEGSITNSGSGYVPGTYFNVPLINGSGSGATAEIIVSGTAIISGTITNNGSGYSPGTYSGISFSNNPVQTFVLTAIANPGTPPPNSVYVVDGVTQDTLTFEIGNTYWFDISDASLSTHPLVFLDTNNQVVPSSDFVVEQKGTMGTAGSYVQVIVKNTATPQTIKYDCSSHPNMGASISVVTGTPGTYGYGAAGDITVDISGQITSITLVSGFDYKLGDIITVYNGNVGGVGSGFEYTVSGSTYNSTVSSVAIASSGVGYRNADVLSVNNSSLGGVGSSFEYTIANYPGTVDSILFSTKGVGYQVGDTLQLPQSLTGISATLKGSVFGVSATLSDISPVVNLTSTTGIIAGMEVTQDPADVGEVAQGSTVLSVDSPTQITLSVTPTIPGSATLTFTSPGNILEVEVSSATGVTVGASVSQTSGSGSLDSLNPSSVVAVDYVNNIVTLSSPPLQAGSAVLSFVPPFGDPADDFEYQIDTLGVVTLVSVNEGGNGYSLNDQISVNPSDLVQPTTSVVSVEQLVQIDFVNVLPDSTFSAGDVVSTRDGALTIGGYGLSNSPTDILSEANQSYLAVASTTSGSGIGATFNVSRDGTGFVVSTDFQDPGYGYATGDLITIPGSSIGGSSPTDDVVLAVSTVTQSQDVSVYEVLSSGGNIDSIIIGTDNANPISSGSFLDKSGTFYEVNSVSFAEVFFIDVGNGPEYAPSFTFYSGDTYEFDLSDPSNAGHSFSFSEYPDGIWSPSLVENISSVLSDSSADISVASPTGILVGMEVLVTSGNGTLVQGTLVEAVNGNTITLSQIPIVSGAATLSFRGVEYTQGVTKTSTLVSIKVTDQTPNLYYYCPNHQNMGGFDNYESLITVSTNNPRVFGSGLVINVDSLLSEDKTVIDIESGTINTISVIATDGTYEDLEVTNDLTTGDITTGSINTPTITYPATISVNATSFDISGNLTVGSGFTVNSSSSNLLSSGQIKTTGELNINDVITVNNNNIASLSGNDILLSPSSGRVAKINTTTSLVIPVGDTSSRPGVGIRQDGCIRYNTDTNQYEGYNDSTASWASLGGVRDIDGNTYILAELTAGANDNTLWFYNDNANTLKLTPQFLDFRGVKKISSGKLGLPAFTLWSANTPVTIGDYVKYRNNLYSVTASGTTASSGNEPTHTSGVANNGTAQLTWYSSSVSPLEFTEIEELRVGPNKDCPLIVSAEIKLFNNVISTIVDDLVLTPNSGKKVSINAPTSLVIPVGNINQRGSASQGSIRFNTTISQFEGYSGTNWSSLGGVRDVDGNTYIIPETAPAANENILYFYNDNINTLQVTTTALDFTNLDTITTSGGNSLALNTEIVTLDNSATTIDNTGSTSTFISTTKQYLDLGLSTGLTVDPVLRLDDQGDVYLNTGFGTGSFNGVKIFDGDLKDFELADYAVKSQIISLVKGTSNSGAAILYNTSAAKGCKVTVVSKSSAGKKSMAEYNVIDNGTDIFFNEVGSLNTSLDGFTAQFDITPGNETRITLTLSNDHATNDTVEITVLTQVVK